MPTCVTAAFASLELMLCKGRTPLGHHCFPTTMPFASGELRRTRVSSKLTRRGSLPFSEARRHKKSRHCQKPPAWAHVVCRDNTWPFQNRTLKKTSACFKIRGLNGGRLRRRLGSSCCSFRKLQPWSSVQKLSPRMHAAPIAPIAGLRNRRPP